MELGLLSITNDIVKAHEGKIEGGKAHPAAGQVKWETDQNLFVSFT